MFIEEVKKREGKVYRRAQQAGKVSAEGSKLETAKLEEEMMKVFNK